MEGAIPSRRPDLMTSRCPERAPWNGFPPVIRNGDLKELSQHHEYAAAKKGNAAAALMLIQKVLRRDTIEEVRASLGDHRPRLVPVLAQEEGGRNMIPLAMATVIGYALGLPVETGIVQLDKIGRTGKGADYRLVNLPRFTGNVTADQTYFLLDDTLAMGGTIACLRGYVENRAGRVVGAAVMTAHPGALDMNIKPAMIEAITRKHGPDMNTFWQQEFGYGIQYLTQGEAGHLKKALSVDAIRNRVAQARDGAGTRLDARAAPAQALNIPACERFLDAAEHIYPGLPLIDGCREAITNGDRPGVETRIAELADLLSQSTDTLLLDALSQALSELGIHDTSARVDPEHAMPGPEPGPGNGLTR